MTGFRPPSVAGVSGGVGVTTLALALHGRDSGTGAGIDADIVVCRSSAESLDRAVRIADLFDPTAVPPVLAVTVDGAERRRPERLDELGPGWAAVVLVPHVGRWRGIVDPYREAAGLLGTPRDRLPRAVRPFLDAVTRLARAVADSGRLTRPAPATRPVSAPLRPGPAPISAPLRPEPAPIPAPLRPEPAPPRSHPRPITTSLQPTPRLTGELSFGSYRAFVPVGADGPLAPRPPLNEPPATGRVAETDPTRPDVADPPLPSAAADRPASRNSERALASHPDLRPVRGIRILDVGDPLDVGPRT